MGNTMGKAIRNFKDAIAGVEEASFRKLDEAGQKTAGTSAPQGPETTAAKEPPETNKTS